VIKFETQLGSKAQTRIRRIPPLKLPEGPHLLLDWRFINPGRVLWVSREDNKPLPLNAWHVDGFIEAICGDTKDIPQGIRIVAQKAQKSEPFPGNPPGALILYDGGTYRTWYGTGMFYGHYKPGGVTYYAESKDGFTWVRETQCVFDWSLCDVKLDNNDGGFGEGMTSVFIDPSAPQSERYKRFIIVTPRYVGMGDDYKKRVLEEFSRIRPDDIDPLALKQHFQVIYGVVSPDGVHWKVLPNPLAIQVADTMNRAHYDVLRKRYVWYTRCWWYYGRRCVARAETEDFRHWPTPEMLLWPDTDLLPSDDWYTNGYTIYPGTVDHHLMFPALYHRAIDSREAYMFSSPDGIVWTKVPGGPVLTPGRSGSWDAGDVCVGAGLVPLSDNRVGIPYVGYPYPHKYPRNRCTMTPKIAYAYWPRGRLAALEASGSGSFSTLPLLFSGRRLLLNVQTAKAGKVLVEVADSRGKPLPGRSFNECDPIVGDYFDIPVTWRGDADLGYENGQPVILRFRMRAARLFAFEFR